MQSEGQDAAATAIAAKVPEDNGTVEAGSKPLSRPSEANLAELAKRKEAARRREEAGAAREGQLTAKERRATGAFSHGPADLRNFEVHTGLCTTARRCAFSGVYEEEGVLVLLQNVNCP